MENQIKLIKQSIEKLQIDSASLSLLEPEVQARIQLGLAFSLNSLYYSLLRVQGKVKLIEKHEALTNQTEAIKARYVKLSQIVKKRD